MVVIGVTGGVGTGKSTVAKMFKQLGATVLDADVIAHQVMEPKRLAWRQIVKQFGEAMLNDDQTINRKQLAARIFADEEARKRLERIIHPQVLRHIKQQLPRLKRRRVSAVVLDVPLLLEVGAQRLVDVVVVVTAPPEVQQERLHAKHGWSEEEIAARRGAQWDVPAKVALADYVVENRHGLEATRTQVKQIWKHVSSKARSNPHRK